jgi:hypothetical protein
MPDQNNPAATASLESAGEKREATRYKVLRQGKIRLESRTVYCAVHDLSTTGARLHVGDVKLPGWFELMVGAQVRRKSFGGTAADPRKRRGGAMRASPVTAARPRQRATITALPITPCI